MDIINLIQESGNIVKYCLMLNVSPTDCNQDKLRGNPNDLVKKAGQLALESCRPLLMDGYCYFFGNPNSSKSDEDEPLPALLFGKKISKVNGKEVNFLDLWGQMLFNDAVSGLYVMLRDEIGSENNRTAYNAVCVTAYKDGDLDSPCGMDFLMNKEKALTFCSDNSLELNMKKPGWTKNKTDNGPDSYFPAQKNKSYSETIATVLQTLRPIEAFSQAFSDLIDCNKATFQIQFCDIDLFNVLRKQKKALGGILKMYKLAYDTGSKQVIKIDDAIGEHEYKEYISAKDSLMERTKCRNFTLADKLYLRYKIESIFKFDLADCLFRNIQKAKGYAGLRDNLIREISNIAKCVELPNVLSRHYMLQSALNCLDNPSLDAFDDFFVQLENRENVVRIDSKHVTPESKYSRWFKQYFRMIEYFSKLVFPAYKSCFISYILGFKSKNCDGKVNDIEDVKFLYKILGNYINGCEGAYENIVEGKCGKILEDIYGSDIIVPAFSKIEKKDTSVYAACVQALNQKHTTVQLLNINSINDLLGIKENTPAELSNNATRFYMMRAAGIKDEYNAI